MARHEHAWTSGLGASHRANRLAPILGATLLVLAPGRVAAQCSATSPPNLTSVTSDAGTATVDLGYPGQYPNLTPGATLTIQGICFGTASGRVAINLFDLDSNPGTRLDLTVSSWSAGQVQARLPSSFGGRPPGWGFVRLFDAAGRGNSDPVSYIVAFTPALEVRLLVFDKQLSGGVFGRKKDGTAYSGAPCLDGRVFAVERVTRSHSGSGTSSLKSPNATRVCLAQGWHMGVSAFKTAKMSIHHHVVEPRGVAPPILSFATASSVAGPWTGGLPSGPPVITP